MKIGDAGDSQSQQVHASRRSCNAGRSPGELGGRARGYFRRARTARCDGSQEALGGGGDIVYPLHELQHLPHGRYMERVMPKAGDAPPT